MKKGKESLDERLVRAMEQNPDLPGEFVLDILKATDEEALLKMLEQSQAGYDNGDHQSAANAFATIKAKIRIYNASVELFEGSSESAIKWLNSPAKALGGNTPMEHLCATDNGMNDVSDLIASIEHGVVT